ncbi:unnamed protein product [Rhizophagus irregularis]|nr:unnamed protein product [Rhizophagus irregularis]
MADGLEKIEGVGKVSMDVFLRAGFNTIGDLKEEGGYAQRIQNAIDVLKVERPEFNNQYWKNLSIRCDAIIRRVKDAGTFPYIPSQYMCPISLNWMEDPVVTPSGVSYDRALLEEWLRNDPHDPLTREVLTIDQVYANRNLKDAIEHYRNTYVHFSIPLTN